MRLFQKYKTQKYKISGKLRFTVTVALATVLLSVLLEQYKNLSDLYNKELEPKSQAGPLLSFRPQSYSASWGIFEYSGKFKVAPLPFLSGLLGAGSSCSRLAGNF